MDHESIENDLRRQGVDLVIKEFAEDGSLVFHVNGFVEVRPLVNSYGADIFVDSSPKDKASIALRFRGGGE